MKKMYFVFIPLLLLGCSNLGSSTNDNDPDLQPTPEEKPVANEVDEAIENATEMQKFIYEDQSTVTFIGEGNEYASYTVDTTWLSTDYVRMIVNNGGVELSKYYRINEDGIFLIKQKEYEETVPTVEQLESLPIISTLLTSELEVGATFEGWTIQELDASYVTPYETFNEVIIISKEEEETTLRNYFVAGIGQIASEFEIKLEDGKTEMVTSKLSSIK